MKFALPVLSIFTASAAMAHEGAHLHPHETNGAMLALFLIPIVAVAGYALGRVHK